MLYYKLKHAQFRLNRSKIRPIIAKYMLATLLWTFLTSGIYEQLTSTRTLYIENVSANESSVKVDNIASAIDSTNIELGKAGETSPVDIIKRVAMEESFENIDGLLRLSMCESSLGLKSFNQNYDKRKTKDRGIWMINDYWHSEVTDKQAYDNEWSTRWTISRIKEGYGYEWMCWQAFNDNSYKI
jgi:hypothetical protein